MHLFHSTPFQTAQNNHYSAALGMLCTSGSVGDAFLFLVLLRWLSPYTGLRCPFHMLHTVSSPARGSDMRSMDDLHGHGFRLLRMALCTSSKQSTPCEICPSTLRLRWTQTSVVAESASSSLGRYLCEAQDFDFGRRVNLCVEHGV